MWVFLHFARHAQAPQEKSDTKLVESRLGGQGAYCSSQASKSLLEAPRVHNATPPLKPKPPLTRFSMNGTPTSKIRSPFWESLKKKHSFFGIYSGAPYLWKHPSEISKRPIIKPCVESVKEPAKHGFGLGLVKLSLDNSWRCIQGNLLGDPWKGPS